MIHLLRALCVKVVAVAIAFTFNRLHAPKIIFIENTQQNRMSSPLSPHNTHNPITSNPYAKKRVGILTLSSVIHC